MATVVIVDDEPTIVEVLVELVTDAGHSAVTATNGQDGLILAQQHQPALIITDIWMPHMNGFSLLQALRADPLLANTLVIVMSAHMRIPQIPLDIATAFAPKPLNLDMIERFLHQLP